MSLRNFILFDMTAQAELRGVAIGQPEMLEPAPQGSDWIEVPSISDWTVSIVDGVPTPTARTPDPARPLFQAKWQARARINKARESVEYSFFTWDGSAFDSDRDSQARLQGAFQLANLALVAGQPYSVDWTLADNTVRTLSAMDMVGVGQALAAHILSTHVTARGLKADIEAAADIDAVQAIQWPQPN